MQISFAQYFDYFSEWRVPVYWVAGQSDGRLDIEARLLANSVTENETIVHVELKSKADVASLTQHWCAPDLFSAFPILIIRVANAVQVPLIEWLNQQTPSLPRKILIWSDKLTPTAKKHSIWRSTWIGLYALWPYQPYEVKKWWIKHCQDLGLNPIDAVTEACLLQTGYRIDALRQIASLWQLAYPGTTSITEAPFAATDQLTEQVYDEALNWLRSPKTYQGICIEANMPFYFALKQTIDEVIQLLSMERHGLSANVIMQKMRLWPKKLQSLQTVSRCRPYSAWIQLLWSFSHLDQSRFGLVAEDFSAAFNALSHESINQTTYRSN